MTPSLQMEASIEAWLTRGPHATNLVNVNPQAAVQTQPGAPSLVPTSVRGGDAAQLVPVYSTVRLGQTVAPLQLPTTSSNSSMRGNPAASSRSSPLPSTTCPLCHGVSAEVELLSPSPDASPAAADSPSPPAGASPTNATGASPRSEVGPSVERVQRRALRRVKRGRSINKVGKWWKMYGYSGPPYCQRCSEVFRDHIIRQISNSANCSRANPCTDCSQVLNYLPLPHEDVYAKMDQTKKTRGTRGPKQSKKSAAVVGLVKLSESYDGAEMSRKIAKSPAPARTGVGITGGTDHGASSGGSGGGSRGHRSPQIPGPRDALLPTLRASSLDGGSLPPQIKGPDAR